MVTEFTPQEYFEQLDAYLDDLLNETGAEYTPEIETIFVRFRLTALQALGIAHGQ
jgi:hypothetical protein